MIVFGFAMVYLGRVITKYKGVYFGKIYFSTIFISSITLISFNLLTSLSIINFLEGSIDLGILSSFLYDFITRYNYSIIQAFVGSVTLASLGELVLSVSNEKETSLLNVSELFPSDFKIISGLQNDPNLGKLIDGFRGHRIGVEDKLKVILSNKNIIRFKCVTRSLWIIEQIDILIKENNLKIDRKECRILKSTYESAMIEYAKFVFNRGFSIDLVLKKRSEIIKDYSLRYLERSALLSAFDVKEFDFGDINYIIFECTNGSKEILFFVRDTGPRMERVGLLSHEIYIIELFEILFNKAWKQGKNYTGDQP